MKRRYRNRIYREKKFLSHRQLKCRHSNDIVCATSCKNQHSPQTTHLRYCLLLLLLLSICTACDFVCHYFFSLSFSRSHCLSFSLLHICFIVHFLYTLDTTNKILSFFKLPQEWNEFN